MTTREIVARIRKNPDLHLTSDVFSAIYIFADGSMLSGEFFDGARCQDHRCVEQILEESRYTEGFWDHVFQKLRCVLVEPESKTLLLPKHLSNAQKQKVEALKCAGFEIEK